ncbi:MAG: hypothetical protein EXS09_20035 [Gemmataceae bacterium]|nr:hypothetical protein [Gemmataceae bacterium]
MRKILLALCCLAVLGLCAWLQADTPPADKAAVSVELKLLDAGTGKPIAGIVRVFKVFETKPLVLSGLYDRMRGLNKEADRLGWQVVSSSGNTVSLPRTKLRIEAVSGLESNRASREIDLTEKPPKEISLTLTTILHPEKAGLVAGNTHLHLMNLKADDAEEYLKQIPAADRLKVLFLSYLERAKDDATYITNRYPVGDLKQFDVTGVLVNNGEEHRHNFASHGQGYGHVMFLNLKQLYKPVSLGPGITGSGTDDQPLRLGIEDARKQGGTIIWCHNTFGSEDIPNALANRLDALNVFDGSRSGTFEEGYYRYLNLGMRMPISTGTDWFLYDFARVYAKVAGKLTIASWLEALKAGRCQATNGPLLSLTVDGKDIGEVMNLAGPMKVNVELTATGRHDFQRLELVRNGRVIHFAAAKLKDGVWSAKIQQEIRIEEPSWLAGRIESSTKNEFDRQLFAHTSPIYLDFAGKRVFDIEAARNMQKQMEEARDEIRTRGKFNDDASRDKILEIYSEAAKEIAHRINQRAK